MAQHRYLVTARRELRGGITTEITKAVVAPSLDGAWLDFCCILDISPEVLECPEQLGTGFWDIFISRVSRPKFQAAVSQYNEDPI